MINREFTTAAVLVGSGHENKIYELTNKPLSQSELATVVGKVIGKEINVLNVDDVSYAQGLKEVGLPDFVVDLLTGIQKAIREKALDVESNDFEKLLGRSTTSIEEAVDEVVKSL